MLMDIQINTKFYVLNLNLATRKLLNEKHFNWIFMQLYIFLCLRLQSDLLQLFKLNIKKIYPKIQEVFTMVCNLSFTFYIFRYSIYVPLNKFKLQPQFTKVDLSSYQKMQPKSEPIKPKFWLLNIILKKRIKLSLYTLE